MIPKWQLEALLNNIPDLIWLKDKESRFIAVNTAFGAACGFKAEELISKTDFDIWPKDLAEKYRADDMQVMESGMRKQLEERLLDAQGKVLWIETIKTPLYRDDGVIAGTVGIARDITDRKRTEGELNNSREMLFTILNGLDAVVYIADMNTYEILFANKYTQDKFGNINGNICWKSIQAGQSGPCTFCSNKYLLDVEGNPTGVYQWEFQNTVNGRWYDVRDRAIRWIDGRLVRLEIATDINDRKQLEMALHEDKAELEGLTKKLESANKELEAFSYSVSHDLRQPLRVIDGFSRTLLKDLEGKLDEATQRKFDTIRENTKKMDQLIKHILDFSRLGRQKLTIKETDMEKLATEAWKELQESYPERNIAMNISHLPFCHVDEPMLRQVFSNLFTNAIKFTKVREAAMIEVGGKEKEDHCVYYVKDNGAGFDMRFAHKLFKLFHRLHSDEEFEGTGVGLSFIKRIIERHGGRIWAEGKVNEGATFYFALPKVSL